MTRVVAIDTASGLGSVALVESGASPSASVVGEIGLRGPSSHAASVLRWIDWLLAECGWSRSTVDRIAVVHGPGSFTGIRVGLGTACGLSLASGRPALGISTLDALSTATGPCESERMALLDAGRGELYGASYDPNSDPACPIEGPWLAPRSRAIARLERGQVVLLPGYGLELGPLTGGPGARVARTPNWLAGAAGRIAAMATDPELCSVGLTPLYLRPSNAQAGTRL